MSQRNFQKYFIIFGIIISFFGATTNYMFQMYDINKSTDKKAEEIFDIKTQIILNPALKNMDNIVQTLATIRVAIPPNNILTSICKSAVFEHYIIDKDNNYILHPNNNYSFNKYKGINRDLKEI